MHRVLLLVALVRSEECQDSLQTEFLPIRIRVEYSHGVESSLLRDTLVPAAVGFMEKSVSVRRRTSDIRFPRGVPKCASVQVNEEFLEPLVNLWLGWFARDNNGSSPADVDLIVFIELADLVTAIADAVPCLRDACGRPIAGTIRVDRQHLAQTTSPMLVDQMITTIIHELSHIMVFHEDSFFNFRDPKTLAPLHAHPTSVWYRCVPVQGERDRFRIDWDIDSTFPWRSLEDVRVFQFSPKVIAAIQVRGIRRSKCRCPIDPNIRYTNEDIEDCLHHPNNCAFAVVTPRVARATQEYFSCSSAVGMELENALGISCGTLPTSHWKSRLLKNELMMAAGGDMSHISPITFALFEDSGWYKMNYEMTTPTTIPKIFWGHHAGCSFLNDKCVDATGRVLAQGTKTFCMPGSADSTTCSPDHLHKVHCDSGGGREQPDITQLSQYQYPGTQYRHELQDFDHCPVFDSWRNDACLDSSLQEEGVFSQYYNYDSRCHEVDRDPPSETSNNLGFPECVRVLCSSDQRSYRVVLHGIAASDDCRSKDSMVYVVSSRKKININCGDPMVVCAKWDHPHLPHSKVNGVPGSRGESLKGIPVTVQDTDANVDYLKKSASALDSFTLVIVIIGIVL